MIKWHSGLGEQWRRGSKGNPNHSLSLQGDPDRVPWLTAIQQIMVTPWTSPLDQGQDLQARVGDLRPHGMSAPQKTGARWFCSAEAGEARWSMD